MPVTSWQLGLATLGSLVIANCSPALCSQLGTQTSERKQGEWLSLPAGALCSDPTAGCGEQGLVPLLVGMAGSH